jgi:hypothetical protein
MDQLDDASPAHRARLERRPLLLRKHSRSQPQSQASAVDRGCFTQTRYRAAATTPAAPSAIVCAHPATVGLFDRDSNRWARSRAYRCSSSRCASRCSGCCIWAMAGSGYGSVCSASRKCCNRCRAIRVATTIQRFDWCIARPLGAKNWIRPRETSLSRNAGAPE